MIQERKAAENDYHERLYRSWGAEVRARRTTKATKPGIEIVCPKEGGIEVLAGGSDAYIALLKRAPLLKLDHLQKLLIEAAS